MGLKGSEICARINGMTTMVHTANEQTRPNSQIKNRLSIRLQGQSLVLPHSYTPATNDPFPVPYDPNTRNDRTINGGQNGSFSLTSSRGWREGRRTEPDQGPRRRCTGRQALTVTRRSTVAGNNQTMKQTKIQTHLS